MAGVHSLGSVPANVTWNVNKGTTNGDDERLAVYFAMPGGYTVTRVDGVEVVTITDPLDVTGRTFTGSVAVGLGGTVLCPITLEDPDPTDGEASLVLARSDLIAHLPAGHNYRFDLVQNLGLSGESTVLLGSLIVTGRASA